LTVAAPLATLLTRPASAARPIAEGAEGPIDWTRFRGDVARAAALLAAEPGPSAALYESDSYRFAVWLWAAWHAGRAVILPADPQPATAAALGSETGLMLGELPGARPLPAGAAPDALAPVDRERALLRVYTSGSTGRPQLIDKTLAQLEAEIGAIEAALGRYAPADALVAGSVSHQQFYGLMFRVLWPLATGRPLLARALRFPEELALVPRGRASVLVTSPVFLGVLADGERALPDGTRLVLSAGSALAASVARRIAGAGALVEIYGSTETGAVAARHAPGQPWQALPGVGIRIAEDSTLEFEAAQLAARGWQRSADRARAVDGGFELLGRSDRIAKIADKRVSLDRLEAALLATPLVSAARVVVLAGPRPELGAVLVPSAAGSVALGRDGPFALGRELRRVLSEEFEPVVLPRRFRFVAELPRDPLGKIRATDLEALFAAARRRPIVSRRHAETERATLTLEIDRSLACFDGHFPEQPIVPGLAQLDWAISFAREHFAIGGEFAGVDALKFQRVIVPGTSVTLTLEWREGTLAFRYASDGPHSSGRILFGAAGR